MATYLLRRLLATIPVLLIVAVLVFLMLRLTPGDPAAILAGDAANTEQIARIRASLGLDQPIVVQFGIWIGNLLSGDLGESFYYKTKVATLIGQRLEPTLALATLTITIAILVAVPLGVIAAWRFGGWFDRSLMAFSVLGFSVPVFVLAYILIWIVSLKLGWLPVQGYLRLADAGGAWPFMRHLILPAITLSVIYIALIARVTRAAVLDTLGEDYIRTARAKGLWLKLILSRHALKNAILPVLTVISLEFAFLLGGLVVTEQVFNLNGLGMLFVEAIARRDYTLTQALVMLVATFFLIVNFVVDIAYAWLDPRIRYR